MSSESQVDEQSCFKAFEDREKKKCLQMLIQIPSPAKVRGPSNQSLLQISARNGWVDVTKQLATKYLCDPLSKDDDGYDVLHYACRGGNLDVVVYLVQNWFLDPLKKAAKDGVTPLDISRKEEHTDIVQYLQRVVANAQKQGYESVADYLKLCREMEHVAAVTEAMKEGGGQLVQSNIFLQGPPGTGKTSVMRLILGLPPLLIKEQTATGIMENAVRAISTSRLKQFKIIENDDLITMLAEEVGRHQTKKAVDYSKYPTIMTVEDRSLSASVQSIKDTLSRASQSVHLFDSHWYHVVDSGGQPQFKDILPLVYCSPSLNIVVVRLTDELDTKPKVCFYKEGRNMYALPDRLAVTNREFIISVCQTAASQANEGSIVPYVMIVGTHIDKLGRNSEAKIREWNGGLAGIRKVFRDVLICKSEEETIFAINAMAVGAERQKHSKELQECITTVSQFHASPIMVPLRWFAYQLDLDKGESVVRMADCYKGGEAIGMGPLDVQNALRFLSKVALVLYFPEDIPDLVLMKMDPFIGRLSKLIEASFIAPKFCLPAESEQLRSKGLFHKSFLAKIFQSIPTRDLHDDEFLKLMECLKIALHVGRDVYFLPSALSIEPSSVESGFKMHSIPLVFIWNERILPHGFFFTIAVELLHRPSEKGEFMFELRTDIAQWRREIQVSEAKHKIPGVVKLTDRRTWIQVSYSSARCYCSKVYQAVVRATQKAVTRFQHTGIGSPTTGYLCPLCEMNDHYCYLSDDKCFITCSLNNSKTGSSTPDMLCWTEGTIAVLRHTPQLSEVYHLLKPKSHEWHQIGRSLGVDLTYRASLSKQGIMMSSEAKLEAILNNWFESQCSDVSWDTLIQVLRTDLAFQDIAGDVMKYLQSVPSSKTTSTSDGAKKQGFENYLYLKHRDEDHGLGLLEAMEEGKGEFFHSNFVLHGPPGVGKSSVLRLILGQSPIPKQPRATENSTSVVRVAITASRHFQVVDNDDIIERLAGEVEKHHERNVCVPTLAVPNSSLHDDSLSMHETETQTISSVSSLAIQSLPLEISSLTTTEESIMKKLLDGKTSLRMFDSLWHHYIDSGGQPQFLDVFPLLFRRPPHFIIVMRLTEGLDDKPKVQLCSKGSDAYSLPDHLVLTNQQMIIQTCLMAQSIAQATSGEFVPQVFVVGTHKDKLLSLLVLKKMNTKLLQIYKQFSDVLVSKSDDEVMFAMNTMAIGKEREQCTKEIQQHILSATNKPGNPIIVPLKWLAFHLELDKGKGVVSMSKCHHVGKKLKMGNDQVHLALEFLNRAALILYYPDDVPDLVLTKMNLVTSRLSLLIKASFILPGDGLIKESTELRQKGVFTKSFLERVFDGFEERLLSDYAFLKLLVSLKVAVHIGRGEYFLPSVLSLKPPSNGSSFVSESIPLALFWGSLVLPHGFFLTVAKELLQMSQSEDGYAFELRSDITHWRGEIQVSEIKRKIPGVVKMTDQKTWIQVSYSSESRYCSKVHHAVDRATQRALKQFQHIVTGSPTVGYLCPLCKEMDHPCYLSDDMHLITCSNDDSKSSPVMPGILSWIQGENKGVLFSRGRQKEIKDLNIIDEHPFFVQGDQKEKCSWEEYGIHLYLSEGFLEQNQHELILVRAVIGGRFHFPSEWQLVSGLYLVSVPTVTQKKLSIEIEHCVNLNDLPENRQLWFISSVPETPWKQDHFTLAEKTDFDFTSNNRYGTLQLPRLKESQERILGIVLMDKSPNDSPNVQSTNEVKEKSSPQPVFKCNNGNDGHDQKEGEENGSSLEVKSKQKTDPVEYYAYTNYLYKSAKECVIELIALKNLNFHKQVVLQNRQNVRNRFSFCFKAEGGAQYIFLGLKDNYIEHDGWSIVSLDWPCSIRKEDIDRFGTKDCCSPDPPKRLLVLTALTATSGNLRYPVPVRGIAEVGRKINIYITESDLKSALAVSSENRSQQSAAHASTVGDEGRSQQSAGITYKDLLSKEPEKHDVLNILRQRSTDWRAFATALEVDDNLITGLTRKGVQSKDEEKLEEVLREWIDSQCSDVTWRKVFKVLEKSKLNRLAREVQEFLERDEVKQKYKKKEDFQKYDFDDL